MSQVPTSADWHRDPDTAVCACGHTVAEHQEVSRFQPRQGRTSRAKLRPRLEATTRREHCNRCDCRSPR